MVSHKPLAQWLTIMVGCLMVAGLIVFWQPAVTGFVVLDAGPSVELNPDTLGVEDLFGNVSTGLLVIITLIIVQVAVYFLITRIYKDEDA